MLSQTRRDLNSLLHHHRQSKFRRRYCHYQRQRYYEAEKDTRRRYNLIMITIILNFLSSFISKEGVPFRVEDLSCIHHIPHPQNADTSPFKKGRQKNKKHIFNLSTFHLSMFRSLYVTFNHQNSTLVVCFLPAYCIIFFANHKFNIINISRYLQNFELCI